ncbi:MAG: hypothetical protein LBO76_00530 [Treponema sp.]|jgi:hypothetical protein|nr:hypothetical protein [Treponema sp.]
MMNKRQKTGLALGLAVWFLVLFSGCEGLYGKLGGADKTDALYPGDPDFERIMFSLSGAWYSHYAGVGRLDGYRIGKWGEHSALIPPEKKALFPNIDIHTLYTGSDVTAPASPVPGDYFVLYDDTVYGQPDKEAGGNGGWGTVSRYIGIVRAIGVFNKDPNRGVVVIQYLKGCAPQWDEDIKNGQRPFLGIYYRILDKDTVQIANAVNLEAMYNGEKYYTETATLQEAIELNTAENEAEFISRGAVIPQDREQ